MRALLLLLVVPVLAGCIGHEPLLELSGMEWEVEGSMAPDFTGQGRSYPVLLVHHHATLSEEERREEERNPVVCLVDGPPVEPLPPLTFRVPGTDGGAADAAPCEPPRYDLATGRLQADPSAFDGRTPALLAIGGCGSSGFLLDPGATYELRLPGHTFVIEVRLDGTFAVDGRALTSGEAHKATYWLDRGNDDHEKSVRAVFDFPGRWLVSRVGLEHPLHEDPRPERGTGLAALVPEDAADLEGVLGPLIEATPGKEARLLQARIVVDQGRLTEVRAIVTSEDATVAWFSTSRAHGQVEMLGAEESPEAGGVTIDRLLAAFPQALAALGAGHEGTLDLRLARNVSLASPTGTWFEQQVAPPVPCERCLHVFLEGAWQRAWAAQETDAEDARTLQAEVTGNDGDVVVHLWNAP